MILVDEKQLRVMTEAVGNKTSDTMKQATENQDSKQTLLHKTTWLTHTRRKNHGCSCQVRACRVTKASIVPEVLVSLTVDSNLEPRSLNDGSCGAHRDKRDEEKENADLELDNYNITRHKHHKQDLKYF